MPKINILTWYNGVGLQQDAERLAEILTMAGFEISYTDISPKSSSSRFFNRTLDNLVYRVIPQVWGYFTFRLTQKLGLKKRCQPLYDVNIFLELVDTQWFNKATSNCFIPNQEWFSILQKLTLKSFDRVLCKTMHAFDIFESLGCNAEYTGFTSQDQHRLDVEINYESCFHLVGRSKLKGTQAVIDAWRYHPEWPTLQVLGHYQGESDSLPDNVVYINKRLDFDVLNAMQNRLGIRIQTSEAEGFGHVLVEGMSCGTVMVTTNAPPMNEIVTPDRGLLVNYNRSEPKALGHRYYVDPDHLEQQLEALFKLDLDQRRKLGDRARSWYLENDARFKQKIIEVMRDLLA